MTWMDAGRHQGTMSMWLTVRAGVLGHLRRLRRARGFEWLQGLPGGGGLCGPAGSAR